MMYKNILLGFGLLVLPMLSFGNDISLEKKIASMVILGFNATEIDKDSSITKMIKEGLGGVILFDKDLKNKGSLKNIRSPKQLQLLTLSLQGISKNKLLICIDEEGGKVARLRKERGFSEFPSALEVANTNLSNAYTIYSSMASTLKHNGINCNFGPSVDLIYEYNPIIAKLKRSYSSKPKCHFLCF